MAEELARRVDTAQSILGTSAAAQAEALEHAVAESSRDTANAMARLDPKSGASAIEVAGGLSIFAGTGSPFTQGLAMGLHGPVTTADLDAMEAHLAPNGPASCQLEITPFADPTLPALLALRGYRVHEWQLVWTCDLTVPTRTATTPLDEALRLRAMKAGEEDLFLRTVTAGFLESDDVPEEFVALMRPSAFAESHEQFLALFGDEPAGGGALAWKGEIALINGSAVRNGFRRRGAQGALLRARLDRARELGCTVAYSATLPGTASRRNMERYGFTVAYPKIVMLRPAASSAQEPPVARYS